MGIDTPASDPGNGDRTQQRPPPESRLPGLDVAFARQAGDLPIFRAGVSAVQWRAAPSIVRSLGGRLVALWGSDRRALDGRHRISAAYALPAGAAAGLYWLDLALDPEAEAPGAPAGATAGSVAGTAAGAGPATQADPSAPAGLPRRPRYPELSSVFACAARLQRAVADLSGLEASGEPDTLDRRPWLRHASWPADYHALRQEASGAERFAAADDHYRYVAVEGDGVHEIAVGPVHAGIIEPGHFRFSVVGEKILRLEERLGYTHKGIEKRFAGQALADAARLAARVSGDSTVAYGWAYCAAAEAATGTSVSARAHWLRALVLERERVANHLGDLGALGNDAGFAFGLAQFSRLREDWLRRNRACFGHRLLMDWIVPGGVADDLTGIVLAQLDADANDLGDEVARLARIYDGHAGLQDRFAGTGRLDSAQARMLDLTGMAARASGVGGDLRALPDAVPYAALRFVPAYETGGDVAARVGLRFSEIGESLRLIRAIIRELPAGPVRTPLAPPPARGGGAGWVEGWRGEVLVALDLDEHGRIARAHCHDPSWQNWPALEHAVIGNIVPDFPLINKSFNLSYSGQDL